MRAMIIALELLISMYLRRRITRAFALRRAARMPDMLCEYLVMRYSVKYRTVVIPLLISVVLVQGCASYHSVEIAVIEEVAVEILEKSDGNTVQLGMRNGDDYFGNDLEIKADSTSIFDYSTSKRMKYSNFDIKHIVTIDRTSGGMKGFKIGFIVGFIVTAVTCYIAEDLISESDDNDWSRVMVYGAYGGAVGGFAWGLPIGWLIGKRNIYRLEHSDQ